MLKKLALLSAMALTGLSTEANAFGLRVHLYIADEILEDLKFLPNGDCQIPIVGSTQKLPPEVCEALRDHPKAFRAGAIGPDAFPDLVVGQSFVHPGTKDGRQTADWLNLMLSKAVEPKEIAYAYGNVIHAAGDVFAHSYVNNYTGGLFDLFDGGALDIEARHVKLEKYIDQRLKYDPAIEQLEIPASFIVDTMVRTNYIPINKKFSEESLTALFANPEAELSGIVGSKIKAGTPGYHMMVMWSLLAIAEGQERKALCDLVTSVDATTEALRDYMLAEYDARVGDAHLRGIEPPTAPDFSGIPSGETTCEPPKKLDMRGYPYIDGLSQNGEQNRASLQADEALRTAKSNYDKVLIAGQLRKEDLSTNRGNEWWRQLERKHRKAMSKTYDDFLSKLEAQHDAEALQVFTDFWADDMRMAIEAYMDASLKTAQDMVNGSAPFPRSDFEGEGGAVHYSRWFDCYSSTFFGQPIGMAEAQCERQGLLGNGSTLSSTARKAAVGKLNRDIYYRLLSISRWIDEKMTEVLFDAGRVLAPSMTELVDTLINPTRIGRDDLDELFQKNKNKQVKFECVSDWIDADLGMLEKWEGSGFRPDEACLMKSETEYKARKSDYLDPEEFVALQYAIKLGKLSLLDQNGVRSLTRELAEKSMETVTGSVVSSGDIAKMVENLQMSEEAQYSILIDTVRSIDGSYQWNGRAMPYPRAKGYKSTGVEPQHDGYGSKNKVGIEVKLDKYTVNRPGFPLYGTEELRFHVFSQIFPEPFEGEILKAKQFGEELYPFTPCKGDPLRPRYVGEGTLEVCEVSGN
ncbi:MAG: zinc dependent phospholipase C family protein [Litorimonas sp.]